jgi:hypothetical protein
MKALKGKILAVVYDNGKAVDSSELEQQVLERFKCPSNPQQLIKTARTELSNRIKYDSASDTFLLIGRDDRSSTRKLASTTQPRTYQLEEGRLNEIKAILLKRLKFPLKKSEIKRILNHELFNRVSKNELGHILPGLVGSFLDYNKSNFKYQLRNRSQTSIDFNNTVAIETEYSSELSGAQISRWYANLIRSKFFQLETGSIEIDNLIKNIVKDNVITPIEREFLTTKIAKFGLDEELILEQAQLALGINNPYLDNIIHLVFEDGEVESKELEFLLEKCVENRLKPDQVNTRFWQIAVVYYQSALLQYQAYSNWLKLLNYLVHDASIPKDEFRIEPQYYFKVFGSDEFENILSSGYTMVHEKVRMTLIRRDPMTNLQIDSAIQKILELNSIPNTPPNEPTHSEGSITIKELIKIMTEEKRVIGDPAANLLMENVLFRLGE